MKPVWLALLFLTACAASPLPEARREDPPMPAEPMKDSCRAGELQAYVGRSKDTLPPVPQGRTRRLVCTTCMMTMDYSPVRQTVVFDRATGTVKSVKCG
jgi:hypothetical protein